jgi:alcohol dehydrogenase
LKRVLSYRPPFILGHDVAGTVIKVGHAVTRFKVNDEVYARPRDLRIGTFAELIAVDEMDVALKPQHLSMEEAASLPLVGLTSWQALVVEGNLKSGQKVFIQAGSGGVGTFAIQLAKYLGATVATTTSTGNVELVKRLGADLVIDYKTHDFEHFLREYDLVLHSQDNATLAKSFRVLRRGGKLVSISGPPDSAFGKQAGAPWFIRTMLSLLSLSARRRAKKLDVDYSFLFMKSSGEQLQLLTELSSRNLFTPVIDRVYPFEQLNKAMTYLEAGHAKGKVIVKLA